MYVCVCLGFNTHYTHILYNRVRQRECGGIERGCRDKELRQWGGGVAAGLGAGGGA